MANQNRGWVLSCVKDIVHDLDRTQKTIGVWCVWMDGRFVATLTVLFWRFDVNKFLNIIQWYICGLSLFRTVTVPVQFLRDSVILIGTFLTTITIICYRPTGRHRLSAIAVNQSGHDDARSNPQAVSAPCSSYAGCRRAVGQSALYADAQTASQLSLSLCTYTLCWLT